MFFDRNKKTPIDREPELPRPRFKVERDHVVTLDYTIRDEDEPEIILDSTSGHGLLTYLHGRGQLPTGLERALENHVPGDKITAVIPARDAFGEPDANARQSIEKALFFEIESFEIGMEFELPTENGLRYARVIDVDENVVTVDLNHPLSGKNLNLSALVVSVRPGSEDEIEQGKVLL
ncbi:MAG: peptidylprolyl isomerase [Thiotrichales bacterium]